MIQSKCWLAGLLLLATTTVQAQGLLNKVKSKIGQGNGEAANAGGKDLDKDSLSLDLDNISIIKDRNNIGGIYFLQKPLVHTGNDEAFGPKLTRFKKVLVEADADKGRIWLRTRMWQEELFGKLLFSMGDESWVKDLAKANIISGLDGSSVQENRRYHYLDLKKVASSEKAEYKPFEMQNVQLSFLEPGVLVLHTSIRLEKSIRTCEGPSIINADILGEQTFNLLYKAGTDISKWTPEKIKQQIFAASLTRCQFFLADAIAKNVMPDKKTGFKDEPTNAAILKAAQERAANFKYAETVDYVYPSSQWINMYENIWSEASKNFVRTLTKRRLYFVVSYKTLGGKCSYEEMTLEQANNFTPGMLEEKFGANPVYTSGNLGLRMLDCAKKKK